MEHIVRLQGTGFTHFLAGPSTTRLMAEVGAEVIKGELFPNGDATRNLAFM